ncbi:hypothetical protein EDD11_008682 [Mortierella claussenii]|nr:hypothetical protein EDD11_008682 [Mortierella claussenii]
MPSSQIIHADPQGGQTFPPMLLNTGTGNKGISASLDSVPIGLGSPAIISHPDYGAVASYVHTPSTFLSKSRSPGGGQTRQPPQRTISAGGQIVPNQKHHRTRTSSLNSSSSIASSGIVSSITSTLGATNISYSDSSPSISVAAGNAPTTEMTTIGTGMDDDTAMATGGSSSLPSMDSKPRPGGHPRKAIAARVFECSFPGCNKAYTQLHNLKSHERTGHTPIQKPKPFLCIISGCTKAFSQRKSLALHIRASHKEYKFKPFKCSQFGCQKAYTQLHNLRTHEKTVHALDLSRKRIRNPTPNTGNINMGGSGGSGSSNSHTSGESGGQYDHQGTSSHTRPGGLTPSSTLSSSAFSARNHIQEQRGGGFGSNIELRYESVDDLADYGAVGDEGDEEGEGGDEELQDEDENNDAYEDE